MKLKVNKNTGLVAVEALSDTSFHREGDVWGETPKRAVSLINRKLVAAADVPKDIAVEEIDIVEGEADVVADKTDAPKRGRKAGKPASEPKDEGASGSEGQGGGADTGGEGGGSQ